MRVAAPGGRDMLKGVDLTVDTGQVHAIMAKNGSGKSTLCQVLAGRETYEVTQGEIIYEGKDLLELSAEERAAGGGFPGVSVSGGNTGGEHELLFEGGGECDSEAP